MNKINIANILLTRRCNLKCSYCHIVKNYDNQPSEYPKMDYYHKNEIKSERWFEILNKLKLNNPNVFCIFYGGEPFVYPELIPIIQYCHTQDIAYTIISNNTKMVHSKIMNLYKTVGQIRGFTASVDPCLFGDEKIDDDIKKKSLAGFDNLVRYKKDGVANDVVAEITVTPTTLKYLYQTVSELSKNGIWSSITAIDLKKNEWYDFSGITDKSLLVDKLDEVKKIFDEIKNEATQGKLLVHSPNCLDDLHHILPANFKCKIYEDIHNVTIDSDGTFRLCLRIRGTHLVQVKLEDLFEEDGKIKSSFNEGLKLDYDKYCYGCNWTCMFMSGKHEQEIKHEEINESNNNKQI